MSISLHPGSINTDLTRHSGTLLQRVGRMITYPVSYGAINSLYAGTAPAAAELNGKVSIRPSRIGPPTDVHCFLYSTSPPGHGSHFQIARRLIPSWGRRCGIGVKCRSKTSSLFLTNFHENLFYQCCSLFTSPVLLFDVRYTGMCTNVV